jgi:heat shock protein HslJ
MGEWTLSSIQNVTTLQMTNYPDSIPKNESITITDSSSVIKFSGICNNGWGTYSMNGSKINISPIVITQVLCPDIIWEEYLLNNLQEAFMYTIDYNQLIIRSSGTFNLIFRKKQ